MTRPGPNVTSDADTQPGSDSLFPTGFSGGGALVRQGSVGTGEIADGSVAGADLNLASVTAALNGTYAGINSIPGSPQRNVSPAVLSKWRNAVARVRTGNGDAKLLCVGDSTTWGYGSSTTATCPPYKSFGSFLAAQFNAMGLPAARGLGIPISRYGTGGAPDNRWTVGTGWSNSFAFGAASGASYGNTSTISGNLVYADTGVNADRFDVYYGRALTWGSLGITATGGSTATPSLNVATSTTKTTVSAASAATTNSVTITGTAPAFVLGVEPYLSTTSKVRVGNMGVSTATSTNWTQDSGGLGGAAFIKAYAPDLTIISLGINTPETATSLAANLATLITAGQVSGDVIVMSFWPSNPTNTNGLNEPALLPVFSSLTVPVYDWNARAGSYANAVALGWSYDSNHGNDYAYADCAQMLASLALI